MMASGASGYALKDDAPEELLPAIHAVARGETWFSRTLRARYDERLSILGG